MHEQNKAALEKIQDQLERKYETLTDPGVLMDDLEDCLAEILDYCNREVLVGNMDKSVKDLYIIRFNREGNEGEVSRVEGGISRGFETGLPKHLRMALNKYRLGSVRRI